MENKNIIKNKYDVYNVNDALSKHFKSYLTETLNATEVEHKFLLRWFLWIVLAVSILFSYFHATPFPFDKPMILFFTMIYYIMDWSILLFDKFVTDYNTMEFAVDEKAFLKKYSSWSSTIKGKVQIYYFSEIKLYSNIYHVRVTINKNK